VRPADRLEQPQVGAAQSLGFGDPDQHRGAGIGVLVHRVPEAGHEPARRLCAVQGGERHRVPAGVVGGQLTAQARQHVVQVPPAVLGDPEEAGPAAEQPGGQRALQ